MIKITAYKLTPDTIANISSARRAVDDDLLNWLIFSSGTFTASTIKVVWSLDSLADMVLKTLPANVVSALIKSPHKAFYNNFRLFHIPGKTLGVSKNGSDADFYSLNQYFPNEPEPKSLRELQEKANQLQTALEAFGIDSPRSLASPLACFKGHDLLKSLDGALPSITDLPDDMLDAQEVALQSTPREWTSNYQVGHFHQLWKHDIASAFPSQAIKLPDLRDCHIAEATESELKEVDAGFVVGDITIDPDHPYAFCSPFITEREDGTPVNFVGSVKDYQCSLDDIKLLYEFKMGAFKLKKGWGIGWDQPRFPLAETMNRLFALRGDDPLKSYLLKRVMNGVIGKLLETRKDEDGNVLDLGDNYNPICHALITNPIRLKVFRTLVEHKLSERELVHVGVDGFRSTRRLPFPSTSSIGEWRCAGSEPAFILSPGSLITPDRQVKGTGYDDLLLECASKPKAHLLGCDRSDPIDLNKLFLRQTRNFPELPETAEDLLLKEYQSTIERR